MSREPINWKDHIVEHPNRYRMTDNGDGTVELNRDPGEVFVQGTMINAEQLNQMDAAIIQNQDELSLIKNDIQEMEFVDLKIKVTDQKGYFTSENLDGVLDELFTFANSGKQHIASAIGNPASNTNTFRELADIIDQSQDDIRKICNEKGAAIPANPNFLEIIDGITRITHFIKSKQIVNLQAIAAGNAAPTVTLTWTKPTSDANYSGVLIRYKTGSYPTGPADGTQAYIGAGTSATISSGLSHNTTYYFRAFAYNLTEGTYTYNDLTTGAQITAKPTLNISSQVTNFKVIVGNTINGWAQITWTNPADSKFKGVIIRYKTGSYPTGPADGTEAYNGTGTSKELTNLVNGSTYYFRAFSYNKHGTVYAYNTSVAQAVGTPYLTKGQVIVTSSKVFEVPINVNKIDVFCVGGGGAGGRSLTERYNGEITKRSGGGGGGGYTATAKNVVVTPGQKISCVVGAGGISIIDAKSTDGGSTSFGTILTAEGGKQGKDNYNGESQGGDGGSGGGTSGTQGAYAGWGGSNGGNGFANRNQPTSRVGKGQGTTTRAFAEASNTLYSGGGGGGGHTHGDIIGTETNPSSGAGGAGGGGNGGRFGVSTITGKSGEPGAANSGGGGGGAAPARNFDYSHYQKGGDGGSGVIIVRWGY